MEAERDEPESTRSLAAQRRTGRRVRQLREARGLSRQELGAAAGYSRQGIALIESGGVGISRQGRIALALALGVPQDQF
jgi:transcriptional regulator with XRE-family HTH domain